MAVRKDAKQIILEVIRKSTEGLTIQQISDSAEMSRITATKYIHELLGEGRIYEKNIGAYRLFFLKERFLSPVSEAEILEKLRKKLR